MKQLVLLLSVLISSCATVGNLPERPNIPICIIDYPESQAVCGFDKQQKIFRIKLSDLDHGTAFSPGAWEEMQNYLDFVEESCNSQNTSR